MKRVIARSCATYGWVATVFSTLWFSMSVTTTASVLSRSNWVLAVWALHGLVLCLTFQQFVGRVFWQPLTTVTTRKLWVARMMLAGAAVLVGVTVSCGLVTRFSICGPESVLASFTLLSSIYIGWHWELRPENLFTRRLIRLISDPLGSAVTQVGRKKEFG